ncbi:MAG TPA: hypothetical protein VFA04_00110 [Bryobacteraceae bacterium]|nr:hypothetical protein [Bryobacteraceae bacterium]
MLDAMVLIGFGLFAAGIIGMLRLVPALATITYPLAWWGLLIIVDSWNYRRRRLSLWRGGAAVRFFVVDVPASALLWLFFEVMNLPAPEWIYLGGFDSIAAQTLLGFVSFATVVPIVVEAWWLVHGPVYIPATPHAWRAVFLLLGAVTLVLPWFNHIWYLNQGMWIAPALLLMPFLHETRRESGGRWLGSLALAGLLSGVTWESLNYPSPTHWEYRILPHAAHLFQMPLPGYIGFIPFALTCLAVYEASRRIPVRLTTAFLLYSASLGLMFIITRVYYESGIWRP